ncbi:hypothetical protein M408DRAFT_264293 [Serendipita vermifera MAFF 305830]|uniref:Uncharacterized protein n=1 Tax=Serendipita vermifera MAFF 305830 TaxID=933852 RepID=A0A0C3AVK8_SERVB|nr:hypothetical protein M408DRAFT_264293 [Serendipita vermifera MAFF 305830]
MALGIIINDNTSLPARVFLAGDNIPIYLLGPYNSDLLLAEFGLSPKLLPIATLGVYFFHTGAAVFGISLLLLMYHNVFKTEWQRPCKEYLYIC